MQTYTKLERGGRLDDGPAYWSRFIVAEARDAADLDAELERHEHAARELIDRELAAIVADYDAVAVKARQTDLANAEASLQTARKAAAAARRAHGDALEAGDLAGVEAAEQAITAADAQIVVYQRRVNTLGAAVPQAEKASRKALEAKLRQRLGEMTAEVTSQRQQLAGKLVEIAREHRDELLRLVALNKALTDRGDINTVNPVDVLIEKHAAA
jgi:hypothetical protein